MQGGVDHFIHRFISLPDAVSLTDVNDGCG